MYERNSASYQNTKREILSFPEGELSLSLSLSYCKKNPKYSEQPFLLLQDVSIKELHTVLFRFLQVRPRSVWECEKKLQKLGFLPLEIKKSIDYFLSQKWLDDKVFALFLLEGTQSDRPVGAYTIQQKLKEKHVDSEIIHQILSEYQKENSFEEDGWKLLQNQLYRFEKYEDPHKKREKIQAYLYRRGFSGEDIKKILKKL